MLKIGYDVRKKNLIPSTRQEQNSTDTEITSNTSVLRKKHSSSPFGGNSKNIFLELSKFTSRNKLFFFITHLLSRLFGIIAGKFCLIFAALHYCDFSFETDELSRAGMCFIPNTGTVFPLNSDEEQLVKCVRLCLSGLRAREGLKQLQGTKSGGKIHWELKLKVWRKSDHQKCRDVVSVSRKVLQGSH